MRGGIVRSAWGRLGGPSPLRWHLAFLVVGTLIPVAAFSVFIVQQLATYQQSALRSTRLIALTGYGQSDDVAPARAEQSG